MGEPQDEFDDWNATKRRDRRIVVGITATVLLAGLVLGTVTFGFDATLVWVFIALLFASGAGVRAYRIAATDAVAAGTASRAQRQAAIPGMGAPMGCAVLIIALRETAADAYARDMRRFEVRVVKAPGRVPEAVGNTDLWFGPTSVPPLGEPVVAACWWSGAAREYCRLR